MVSTANSKSNDDDGLESYRNFQKMMAAGSEVAARIGLSQISIQEPTISKSIERPPSLVDSSSGVNTDIEKDKFNNKDQWIPLQIQSLTKSQKFPDVSLFVPVETPVR